LKKGLITKLIGGLYTVIDEDNNSQDIRDHQKFRHTNESPKVGDNVLFDEDLIRELFERKNNLVRPPVANIDQAILINSCKEPDFSFNLLDRFLLLIEHENITPLIVLTKIDLMEKSKLDELKVKMKYYEKFYDVLYCSAITFEGVEEFKSIFKDKISVFAGQTGAGKSSLLNALNPEFDLETNIISKALGRGKHTTRHSELLPLFDGLVADTPGFSKLDFYDIKEENVPDCFVDFFEISNQCKYRGCKHLNEPKCEVKRQVELGNILSSRHHNYTTIMAEIKEQKPKY